MDQPDAPLPLPDASVVIARGPFAQKEDEALLREHRITHVVAKNGGGIGARAKLDAARVLGLPVIMAQRPSLPNCATVASAEACMTWLASHAERGV